MPTERKTPAEKPILTPKPRASTGCGTTTPPSEKDIPGTDETLCAIDPTRK